MADSEEECGDPMLVDRPLTEEERSLALWMLENGKPEASAFIPQLEKARVFRLCGCGCASVDFKIEGHPEPAGGLHILGDYIFGDNDAPGGAFIFEQDGLLSGIEVLLYDGHDACRVLPKPSELRSF